jgi:hypothetical protein
MVFLENKINRHYNFGLFNKMMTHALTAALGWFYYVQHFKLPQKAIKQTPTSLAAEKEYGDELAMIGTCIYACVILCCIVSFVFFRMIKKKSWENISVRNGLLIAKAAMLVSNRVGPLLYFCLVMQFYNFSLVINHRRDSRPGASFPIQIFFSFFTMQQYFFRSNHRERFSSLQVGKVCPGGVFCGELTQWALVLFELFAPFFVCLSLLPLVVKARVQHAYAHTKKTDDKVESTPLVTPQSQRGKKGKVSFSTSAESARNQKATPKMETEFVGNMEEGMAYLQLITYLLLLSSSIFVWWSKTEIIFPERSAPKYVFDVAKTAVIVPFTIFWM